MLDGLALLPWVWAQTPVGSNPVDQPLLALRRWYGSLTLTSPDAAPTQHALVAWLLGLAALLVVAMVFQGPGRALGQLVDLPSHLRLLREAMARFRSSGRAAAVLLGAAVLTWTVSQFAGYSRAERLEDLQIFRRAKTQAEIAFDQASLAALTPLRDVIGLGDTLLLLVLATVLVFKLSADRWGESEETIGLSRPALPPWTTLCWGCTWLYAMYRFAGLVVDTGGLPLGGCLFVEAAIIPILMAIADGLLLAWLLIELRNAGLGGAGDEGLDVRGAIAILPTATLACLAALPGRYAAPGAWLLVQDVPSTGAWWGIGPLLRGWGIADFQAAALLTVGLAGAVAWGTGSPRDAVRSYFGMLRAEGGRLVAWLAFGGIGCGAAAAAAYAIVLSLPAQPWVLSAADSYAHYATLPIGLVLLAGLVELGSRALPEAGAVEVEPDDGIPVLE